MDGLCLLSLLLLKSGFILFLIIFMADFFCAEIETVGMFHFHLLEEESFSTLLFYDITR